MTGDPIRSEGRDARIVLYAHAQLGVGHVRRSALLAEALQTGFAVECWLLACRQGLQGSVVPASVKAVPLPDWPRPGGAGAGAICRQRVAIIDELVRAADPDVFVVDHLFLGLGGELAELLGRSRQDSASTRFVIGLPYGPSATAAGPRNRRIRNLMARYDEALCYTDERYERPAEAFVNKNFPIPAQRRSVGYVIPPEVPRPTPPPARPLVVALAGGGSTGAALFEVLLDALAGDLEAGRVTLRLVLGPLFGTEASSAALRRANVEVVTESSLDAAVAGASAVISRCGYNNAYTLLESGLPTIFCPFSAATSDQPARAEALSRFDRIWTVLERDGPEPMRAAIQAAIAAGPCSRGGALDCNGAQAGASELVRMAHGRG